MLLKFFGSLRLREMIYQEKEERLVFSCLVFVEAFTSSSIAVILQKMISICSL